MAAEFRDTDAELLRTNLTDEQEAKLREAFGLADEVAAAEAADIPGSARTQRRP